MGKEVREEGIKRGKGEEERGGGREGGGKIRKLRSGNRKSYQNFTSSLFKRLQQESLVLSLSFFLVSFSFLSLLSLSLLFSPAFDSSRFDDLPSPSTSFSFSSFLLFSSHSLFLFLILSPLSYPLRRGIKNKGSEGSISNGD